FNLLDWPVSRAVLQPDGSCCGQASGSIAGRFDGCEIALMNQTDLNSLLPVILLTTWACALLAVDLWIPKDRKGLTALLAALGLILTLVASLLTAPGDGQTGFNGMVARDGFSGFLNALLIVIGLLGIAVGYGYIRRMNLERGEYYSLILFSV